MHAELRRIIGRLEDFAAKVQHGLAEADWTSKRDLIRALVKRVEVARDDVNIVFRIDPYPGDADPEKKSLQLCRGSDLTCHCQLGARRPVVYLQPAGNSIACQSGTIPLSPPV